jgi:hypothetical protein
MNKIEILLEFKNLSFLDKLYVHGHSGMIIFYEYFLLPVLIILIVCGAIITYQNRPGRR